MKKNCDRKSARGGRALLTGLMRCGRCGRMMRVFYGMGKGNAHRYQCRGDDAHVGAGLCIGIGGVRIDRAVALQILDAVSGRAVEAAILASEQVERSQKEVIAAVERELEAAHYDASLAARRYELVDPAKRHVARELEARWNAALERVAELERRLDDLKAQSATRPKIDRARLLQLAHDLPAAWNAPSADTRTKQRLIHILIREIVCDLDDASNEAVLLIHWTGGRHTEVRVPPRQDRPLPCRSGAHGRRCTAQARRALAGSGTRRVAQPDALQDRRRRDLDDRPGQGDARAVRSRRL